MEFLIDTANSRNRNSQQRRQARSPRSDVYDVWVNEVALFCHYVTTAYNNYQIHHMESNTPNNSKSFTPIF